MEEFIVIGDLHIDKPKPYPNYVQVAIDALCSILDYAKENGVRHIILLGDLFDTPYPSDKSKVALLKSLEDQDLEFHIILGNHDWSSTELNSLELLSYLTESKFTNVHLYTAPTKKMLSNLRFQFLPFPHAQPISDKTSICCSHVAYSGFRADNGRVMKKGPELNRKHRWFVGHIHLRQKDIYPGSILQNTFGETEDKYFFHVIAENQHKINVQAVPIPQKYKLRKVVIKSEADFKKLIDDKTIYYNLDVQNEVIVPPKLDDKFNIVNMSYFRDESELDTSTDLVLNRTEMEALNPTFYLDSFLKARGVKPEDRKRGKLLINKLMKGL